MLGIGKEMQPVQCKMARAALGWGVRKLAAKANVSPETVVRFENCGHLRERTIQALRQALEKGGTELIFENGGGVGVTLKKWKSAKR